MAPERIKAEEADRQLVKGFQENDKAGKPVRFGLELKEKLVRASDGVARKELLGWTRDTVRTGKAREKVVNGEVRTHYGKIYQDKKEEGVPDDR